MVSFESESFAKNGFYLFKNFFPPSEREPIEEIVSEADGRWREEFDFPQNVNSAYLTRKKFLPDGKKRDLLFRFVAQEKLVSIAKTFSNCKVYFLNTQLFFNPKDAAKKPYWHRDVQYLGVDEETQKEIVQRDVVYHFRIPFAEDPGIEVIPGSHNRWDTDLERKVRLETDGHGNYEELPGSVRIPHSPGDLLVFSAHLIHRGTYGLRRSSFDILYASFPSKRSEFVYTDYFPEVVIPDSIFETAP
ncbi:deoxygenase [Leptospira yasudae]|uniref:Deoxygenase n=1 Tax=Leptospira yasudae TaxID=2202201 RepID=A0A6N4QX87_9LEPT|nr:deoxygenase [Leptospira yasudae]TGL82005.1 deoxygenase [Leptospira yasudae]TGL84150.1 deoxygenase [Leptospira yasudae]